MKAAIEISKLNVLHKTGGPFGAIIFSNKHHQIISAGTNLVTSTNNSILHAEIIAIMLAQASLQTYNLSNIKEDEYILFSSGQPCAMCYGSILWSGIKQVVFSATKSDIENITGFDEGPLHPHWQKEALKRDINITGKILHKESIEILKQYKNNQGIIYNG